MQAAAAEGKLIIEEFNGAWKKSVYEKWQNGNKDIINSAEAAYNAAYRICMDYESPKDKEILAPGRGEIAQDIYNAMMGF